jgi:hypothetical protein
MSDEKQPLGAEVFDQMARMLELDFFSNGQMPTLKYVFDCLRNFGLVALLASAIKSLVSAKFLLAVAAGWFLVPIMTLLGVMVIVQGTAVFFALYWLMFCGLAIQFDFCAPFVKRHETAFLWIVKFVAAITMLCCIAAAGQFLAGLGRHTV